MNLLPEFRGQGRFAQGHSQYSGKSANRDRSVEADLPREEHAATLRDTVPGPFGEPLSMDDLPPPDTRRWVIRRKAEVLAAINGGLLSVAEACQRYRLSPEELELWQQAIDRAGVPGLRVTRIQLYRELSTSRQGEDHDDKNTASYQGARSASRR